MEEIFGTDKHPIDPAAVEALGKDKRALGLVLNLQDFRHFNAEAWKGFVEAFAAFCSLERAMWKRPKELRVEHSFRQKPLLHAAVQALTDMETAVRAKQASVGRRALDEFQENAGYATEFMEHCRHNLWQQGSFLLMTSASATPAPPGSST